MPNTLEGWLSYQQQVHPRAIELGLGRVGAVYERLGSPTPAPSAITVAGTNGKGSTVAFLEAMLGAQGRRVGAYTSPHLLRYNERIRIAGRDTDDATLIDAFERIESARGSIALTYFEHGTLAALWIFKQAGIDVALLEVGLGGRLDAVNLIDADASIVTTVDLDHQDWLGNDRESIGREKAGIFRRARPAIIGDVDPPQALIDEANRIGARLVVAGRDFTFTRHGDGWCWIDDAVELDLPLPTLRAPSQIANAAAAIATLRALRDRLDCSVSAIASGIVSAQVAARLQVFAGEPLFVVDVAHNPQAARTLAEWLAENSVPGRTLAVLGALEDKDVAGIIAPLASCVDAWFLAGLDRDSPRGLKASALRDLVAVAPGRHVLAGTWPEVTSALLAAFAAARSGDRVVAFGSFFVATRALAFADSLGRAP